ncbi:MAG TPA: matrixin family metalloprotease [Gemmatimonadales bacterium]|nr:matrixin family metalloprotease [Gemmatimonadales bacterium]
MPRVRVLAVVTLMLCAAVTADALHRAWMAHRGHQPAAAPPPPPVHSSLSARAAPLPASAADTLSAGDRAAARRAISAAAGTVYFDSLFAETDSTLRRWPDSVIGSLGIVMDGGGPPEWRPEMLDQVRDAMRGWESALPGLHFVQLLDTTGADITVHWVERLGADRTGQADLVWDRAGRIHHVDVSLALRGPTGRTLSDFGLRAVAAHELGHALGLAHSADSTDVLYPATRTDTLSPRDVATVQLLYRLRPGGVK